MSEKIMLDFPGFITRDSKTHHLLISNESVVLAANAVITEQYRQLFDSLGYDKTAEVMHKSVKEGTYKIQQSLIKTYRISLKDEADLNRQIARFPLYIQTYGYGRGSTVMEGEKFVFRVKDSFEAGSFRNSGLNKTVCFALTGIFAGMAKAYAKLLDNPPRFTCVETKCIAKGNPYCEFELTRNK